MQAAVHPDRLEPLRAELDAINRQYVGAGVAPLKLVNTGRRDGELLVVSLEGDAPDIGRWQILCVLEHQSGRTIVRPCAALSEAQREALQGARALCEACRTVRPRSKTFLLRDRTTGRTVQLGSSCVRPYTRAGSAEAAIHRAEQVAAAVAAVRTAARRDPPPGERYIDTDIYLAHAIEAVRAAGYAPASSNRPTWKQALERLESRASATPADLARARDVRRWAKERRTEDPGSYHSRRASAVEHDRLCSRELSLAASAIPAYNRHLHWVIRLRHRRATQSASETR
ncbi:MAG TPA: hypothetical protein VG275_11140 [Solirubrobacteraceae bacterium]|jgi:hypothetical protein|nr:hypothetical protein [Solirubrobacteraceae bacterium]